MNATPDSRTPRRLTIAIKRQNHQAQRQRVGLERGSAETSAPTPAEMPTATTST